jgi:PleD family two-component response regulator
LGDYGDLGRNWRHEALLKRADAAVYEAKDAGRNKVITRAA